MVSLQKEPEHGQHEGLLAAAGIAVGVLGLVVSVLIAVTSLAAAMLVLGLLVGATAGVLITPAAKRGLAWLAVYLER